MRRILFFKDHIVFGARPRAQMIEGTSVSNITSRNLHLMHFVSMSIMPDELVVPRVEVHPHAFADELFGVLIDHEYQQSGRLAGEVLLPI